MNAFCVTYRYTDLELRARHREAHLARLNELARGGRVVVGGPLTDSSGAVIVLFAESADEVAELMRTDVYSVNGVIADVSITEFTPAVANSALATVSNKANQ
jgi:uncharacterized protein YciI